MEKMRILAVLNIKRMNYQLAMIDQLISPTHEVLEQQWDVLHDVKYKDPADVTKIVGSLVTEIQIPFEKAAVAIRAEFVHYEKGMNTLNCIIG